MVKSHLHGVSSSVRCLLYKTCFVSVSLSFSVNQNVSVAEAEIRCSDTLKKKLNLNRALLTSSPGVGRGSARSASWSASDPAQSYYFCFHRCCSPSTACILTFISVSASQRINLKMPLSLPPIFIFYMFQNSIKNPQLGSLTQFV